MASLPGISLTSYAPVRTFRSSGRRFLTVPDVWLKTKGDRAFAVPAPRLWDDLPEEIRSAESVMSFKSRLITCFYLRAFPDFTCVFIFFDLSFPRPPLDTMKVASKLECTAVVQTLIFPCVISHVNQTVQIVHHEVISTEDPSFLNKVLHRLVSVGTVIFQRFWTYQNAHSYTEHHKVLQSIIQNTFHQVFQCRAGTDGILLLSISPIAQSIEVTMQSLMGCNLGNQPFCR